MKLRIALISSDYFQVFPQKSNGGIEADVETLAESLQKNGNQFFAVTPKRDIIQEYPFEVIDTPSLPSSKDKSSNYIQDVIKILKQRKDDYDIIWANSHWSKEFVVVGKPVIAMIHCGNAKKPDNYMYNFGNLYYRFLSQSHFKVYVTEEWETKKSFICYPGFLDEEFEFNSQKQGYVLWLASLYYGLEAKGIDIFIQLAKLNPHKQFLAYGVGPVDIIEYVKTFEQKIPNFKWCGEVNRGKDHHKVFKNAGVFCQLSRLPESFGRTIVEAGSKGTPVIGLDSPCSTTKEIIGNYHGCYDNIDDIDRNINIHFDYQKVFDYYQTRFNAQNEYGCMVKQSLNILINNEIEETMYE